MSASTLDQPASPTWRRLRHTPLRDLLRGRLTGRLDLDPVVADLPAQLRELVVRTAHRTRLWRLERVDVATELASHFAEGLDAGVTASALAASFGDEQSAARLIRRAKKRARPAIWHVFRFARGAVAGFVGLYIFAGLYFLMGRPDPVTDFGARVNEVAAAIPPGERAWPLYRTALLEGEPTRELLRGFNRTPRPGEDGWAEIEAYLARNEAMLERLRGAAARPGLGFIAAGTIDPADQELWPDVGGAATGEYSNMLIGYLLPHLSGMRQAASVLAMDMHRAAEEGDGARALADLDAMIAGAGFVRELPFLINDLVAFSVLSRAFETTGEILARRPEVFGDAELVALAHRMSQVDRLMTPRFDGERMGFADLLQWMFTDDGDGDGLMPAIGKATVQAEMIAAERDAVLVAVSLELHRRRTGSWPVSLDELVPALLPAVPPDRFDGAPLRYRLKDDGPLVYSVGTNRIDDGGTIASVYKASIAMTWMPPSRLEAPSDRAIPQGDWILWPKPLPPIARYE